MPLGPVRTMNISLCCSCFSYCFKKDCGYLEQFWFVKSLIVREPLSFLVFSPGSISNKGGVVVYYPLAHACMRLVTNTLSAIKTVELMCVCLIRV